MHLSNRKGEQRLKQRYHLCSWLRSMTKCKLNYQVPLRKFRCRNLCQWKKYKHMGRKDRRQEELRRLQRRSNSTKQQDKLSATTSRSIVSCKKYERKAAQKLYQNAITKISTCSSLWKDWSTMELETNLHPHFLELRINYDPKRSTRWRKELLNTPNEEPHDRAQPKQLEQEHNKNGGYRKRPRQWPQMR